MKVYIVTSEPFPNGMAATNRIKCYAKAFISQNIDCEVIIIKKTERYNHPRNIVGSGIAETIPFTYTLGSPVSSRNVIIRHVEERFFWRFKAIRYLKKHLHANDVILWFSGGMIGFVESLIKLAHQNKAVFCRDLCELPFGTSVETPKTINARRHLLESVIPTIDGCISISEALFDLVNQYLSPHAVSIKIPIMVDYDRFAIDDLSYKSEIRYIFHSGTLTEKKDGILGLLKAFALAEQKLKHSVQFVIAGDLEQSPVRKEIEAIIVQNRIEDKVKFLGYLNSDQLVKPLSEASLVVLNKYPTQQNLYGFSTKLGEYMAAGKPVIITDVGEAINWLTDRENAYIIHHGDVQQLANTIVRAFNEDEERKRIGENGRILCKRAFDYKNYGKSLVEMCKQMTQQS